MKEWLIDLVQCTIVATLVTLLWYILRIDSSWEDASQTFGTAFLVMFVLGLYQRLKKNKTE